MAPSVGSLAAVDLGSNSFHMVIAREVEGQAVIVDRLRERVALAEGLSGDRHLDPKVEERAIACLLRFAQRLEGIPSSRVRAVGTATFRMMRGAKSFHERAVATLGHPIEVLGGREEARLVYLGVAHARPGEQEERLVIDIGGASTECILGKGFKVLRAESLSMGCLVFSERFFPRGEYSAKAFKRAKQEARFQLEPIEARLGKTSWRSAVGASGTILAIAGILETNKRGSGSISRAGLEWLRDRVLACGNLGQLEIEGLKDDRKPVLAAGVAILEGLFEGLGIETMHTSSDSLREGLMHDLLGRLHRSDVRGESVLAFGSRLGIDELQASRVMGLAKELFAQARETWALSDDDRDLLTWAAWLHEIGLAISYSGFQRHGAYLLQHADLTGFSRDEQQHLATIVRCHRKRVPQDVLNELAGKREQRLLRIITLLRLAVAIHRGHRSEDVPTPRLEIKGKALALCFQSGWLESRPLTAEDLEREVDLLEPLGVDLACV